jgi:hypothetical protein
MPETPRGAAPSVIASGILRRWPTWAGIGLAVLIGLGLSEGDDLAPALTAMALIYVGAAALRTPSAVWPVFFGAVVVLVVTNAFGASDTAIVMILIGLAVLLFSYGLLSGATGANDGLLRQAIAMVGFGTVAAIALGAGGDVGAYLVAAGVLGHAAWDAYHYRANKTVARPYAEACFVADALLAIAIVIVTA